MMASDSRPDEREKRMTRCLILDVDGVVVDGRPEDGLPWATDIERDLGIPLDRLRTIFFDQHWDDIVLGRKPLRQTLQACLHSLAPSLTASAVIGYWFEKDSRLDRTVLADCDELRRGGTRIYLATNQEPLRANYLMERLALRDHVDGILYSAQIGARKPQRAFFDAAMARAGAAPDDLLLVDDTAANVDAALAAGWQARLWSAGLSLKALLEPE